jgi:hypothetical protein
LLVGFAETHTAKIVAFQQRIAKGCKNILSDHHTRYVLDGYLLATFCSLSFESAGHEQMRPASKGRGKWGIALIKMWFKQSQSKEKSSADFD